MILSRDQILVARKAMTREIEVPEWGGSVIVRALNQKEVNEWRRSFQVKVTNRDKTGKATTEFVTDPDKAEMAGLTLLMIALIDESGNRLFESKADIETLAGQAFRPIRRITAVIMEMSGLTEDAAEEAEKNSEPSPSESSITG